MKIRDIMTPRTVCEYVEPNETVADFMAPLALGTQTGAPNLTPTFTWDFGTTPVVETNLYVSVLPPGEDGEDPRPDGEPHEGDVHAAAPLRRISGVNRVNRSTAYA